MTAVKINPRFIPVVGMDVAVCYDGKWGRAVPGQITRPTKHGFAVRFVPWASEDAGEVEMDVVWYKKRGRYGGWLTGQGEHGVMAWLGCRGDWYSVWPAELFERCG